MRVINPSTEEVIGEYEFHSPEHVEQTLREALAAFSAWRNTSFDERAKLMRRAGATLRAKSAELSLLMTGEMGKPIVGAEGEVEKCAVACDYFAENAASLLADETVPSDASRSYVHFEPLGPLLAIMPWNFPFWQVFRFAAPALMAGNVAVLKHAPNVPGCAAAIESVFLDSGFPPGAFSNLYLDNDAAEKVIKHPTIRAVTLTGSPRAGRAVAAAAGAALKKTVLELGGSDPFIVIPPDGAGRSQSLTSVAKRATDARCINSGQSCIAAKRFIVVGGRATCDEFERHMTHAMSKLKVGDPTDRSTQVGPMARLDLLEGLHDQVERSIRHGARILTGGRRVASKGFFYEPTVLADVLPGMAAFDEETFGPVAAVVQARDVDEAVDLATATEYGLGASIWTPDVALAERVASRIESGCVFVNGIVKSDPRLPFGGIKSSGYGRELSREGLREFVNVKTVWIGPAQ
jgi:succinate-semialdehyde dehydrogenase/glutarate-semialdehyde dehydrogenase